MVAVLMPSSSLFAVDWMLVLAVLFVALAVIQTPGRPIARWRIVCAVLVVVAVITGKALAFPALHPCYGLDPDSWTYWWLGCGWFD